MKRVKRAKRGKPRARKRVVRAKGRLIVGDDGCFMLAPRKRRR